MDSTRYQRMQALFGEAVERPPAERAAFLSGACADNELREAVLAMLDEDARGSSFLETGVSTAARGVLGDTATLQGIGPYRLLRVIGEGGSGVVHLAQRLDLGTQVAVKLLRDAWLSPSRREQFALEQQTLARLNHPSIARLYDAGTLADATPWIVMEYVDGTPITDYCRARSLPVHHRLELVRQVGMAVQHAHRHLIVHRDLKPSNVLVTADGTVKLLDFGIAKQLDVLDAQSTRTRTLMRRMTPAYAAPEQVIGSGIGLHTDVYGLGALLYELLTGRPPFDLTGRSPAAIDVLILEREPDRPSTAARGSSAPAAGAKELGATAWADLDVLCQKAMHKDPARRYPSAEALVRDIEHYLRGEPLEARPDDVLYRARKFLTRNRTPILATTGAAAAALAVSIFYTISLARARDAAVREATRATRLQGLMSNLLTGGEDATAPAESLRVLDVLDRGVIEAESLQGEPAVQAELFQTLGSLYQSLGRFSEADGLLERALERRRGASGTDSADSGRSLVALGLLRLEQGQFDEAERLTREGLALARRFGPPDDPQISRALTAVGQVLEERGGYTDAIPILEEAIRLQSARGGENADLASSLRHLGNVHFYAGNFDQSFEIFERVLAMSRRVHGARHALVATDLINVGAVHFERGRYEDAERYYREALPITEGWYGGAHHQTAANLTMLARALNMQAQHEEAGALLERALAIQERVFGAVHPRVASAVNEIGIIAIQRQRYAEAEAAFSRMADIYRAVYPGKHYLTAIAISNLASVHNAKGEFTRAEPLFREAIELYSETQSPSHLNTGIARIKLGRALLGLQRHREAEAEILAGYEIVSGQTSSSVTWLKAAREDLVTLYTATNQPDKAERYKQELADVSGPAGAGA